MDLRVRHFVDFLNTEVQWPTATEITEPAREAYRQAERSFDRYRGDPNVLIAAIRACLSGDCRPYAFASASLAIQMISFQRDDRYDIDGLREALQWLELAQRMAPDRAEIDIHEVSLYLCMKRTADARAVLDHIARDNPDFHGLPKTEMWYWDRAGNHAQWQMWARRALDLAKDDHERFTLLNIAAGYYATRRMYAEALAAYQKAVRIDSSDPWAWHNMSLIYCEVQQYKEAHRCNETALRLTDFGAAREVEALLKTKRGVFGGWKRG